MNVLGVQSKPGRDILGGFRFLSKMNRKPSHSRKIICASLGATPIERTFNAVVAGSSPARLTKQVVWNDKVIRYKSPMSLYCHRKGAKRL